MTLTLTRKAEQTAPTRLPIDASDLLPELLAPLSPAEIKQIAIAVGNQSVSLEKLFDMSGDPSDFRLELHGDLSNLQCLGARMSRGEIVAHSQVGIHAGSRMTGGELTIRGDAGDWLGVEMRGGLIHVLGNAGNRVGGAYPGSLKGMNGGTIFIEGNCGNETGLRMRRGTIAIAGDVGTMPGRRMHAGTLLAAGACGNYPGWGMKRGTLILLGHDPANLPSAFAYDCHCAPTVLQLIQRKLSALGFSFNGGQLLGNMLQYSGDLNELGKGEIFVPAIAK